MQPVRTGRRFSLLFPLSLWCLEGVNANTSSFCLLLPGAVLTTASLAGITQQCWENGLFWANSSQPAAWEWKWANESLRLLSTTERTKPEEIFAYHTVVINSKCKIFLLEWFRTYFWLSFNLCRLMTSKYQLCDWKSGIFFSPYQMTGA